MQAFICEVVRALMKLGIAIAANRPMMATTIIISTNVKPDLREVLMFILCLSLYLRRERSNRRVSIISNFRSLIARCDRSAMGSSLNAMPPTPDIHTPAVPSHTALTRQRLSLTPLSLTPCFSGVYGVLAVKETVSTVYRVQSETVETVPRPAALANTHAEAG